jgi:signal transduction histidine kinase
MATAPTTSRRRPLRTVATAAAVLLLVSLLTVETCHESRTRTAGLTDLMREEARGVADVVAHVATDALAAGAVAEQLEHIVAVMTTCSRIRYIDLRGPAGAVATSAGAEAALAAAPAAAPPADAAAAYREFLAPAGAVLELARPLDETDLVLRVGLDAEPLRIMRRESTIRQRLHVALVIASLALVSALLLARQRQAMLDREIDRFSRRLERHEEEARRREKLVAMGALGAGFAHQLRNPLNSIHLLAEVLGGDRDLPPAVAENAGHIRHEAERIDASIARFLEFARPREPVLQPCDVATLVHDVTDLQNAAHAAREVEVTGYAPSPLIILADRDFLREILENLLRNAIEAGASRVLASVIQQGGQVEITVADDGPGVPTADRERIFDLYYTSRPDGTGLGLSLANQMAGALSGTLSLSDEAGLSGRGARFVLRLPRGRSAS